MDNVALKEWAVAVKAMEDGLQDVIFRKGGIQEAEGDFHLAHNDFLLYPAREHQNEIYLKPQYRDLLDHSRSQQRGHIVNIHSKARVVTAHLVSTLEEALPFQDRHIWNTEFIKMRLDYKPDRPLYIIELLVEPLARPLEFLETTEYAGCKSWVYLRD